MGKQSSSRRQFLQAGTLAALGLSSGCLRFVTGGDDTANDTETPADGGTVQDSDGDGVVNTEDYAPWDPEVQEKSDLTGSTPTSRSDTTTTPDGSGQASGPASWPQYQHDIRNSGNVNGGSALATDTSVAWQYDADATDRVTAPVADGTRLYIGADTELSAVSLTDGSLAWSVTFDHPVGSGPAVVDGTVYIGTHLNTGSSNNYGRKGKFYALNANDGSERWMIDPIGGVKTPPTVDNGMVFFGTKGADDEYLRGTLYAVAQEDGAVAWKRNLGWGIFSPPALGDDRVYAEARDENHPFYALNREDGSVVWKNGKSFPDFKGRQTVADGVVYVCGWRRDGRLTALDSENGTEIWTVQPGTEVKTSVVVGQDSVYFGTTSGEFRAVSKDTGDSQWQTTLGQTIISDPVLVRDTVYTAAESGTVYGLAAQDGTVRLEHTVNGEVRHTPIVVEGTLYVTDTTGTVYALTDS